MPSGIYIRTKETRKRMSLASIKRWKNPEYREKFSKTNKGKKFSKEHIKKVIESRKRNNKEWHTEETRKKISMGTLKRKRNYGYINSPLARKKISVARLGHEVSKKARIKIGLAHYKGDKAGNKAFHQWLRTHKPKPKYNLCEKCHKRKDKYGSIKLDIANMKNHKYSRNFDDYKWFHRSCHKKYDLENIR